MKSLLYEKCTAAAAAFLLLALSAAAAVLASPFLFGQTKDGWLFIRSAAPGMEFTLRYMHSAMRTPIEERFLINDSADGFLLKSLRYQAFGAGLPYLAGDGHFRREGKWFIMDDMDRRLPDFSLRNGVINHGVLTVGSEEWPLDEAMPLGSELHLYVAPLWQGYRMKKEIH